MLKALHNYMIAQGLPVVGLSNSGRIDWDTTITPTPQQITQAQAIWEQRDSLDLRTAKEKAKQDAKNAIKAANGSSASQRADMMWAWLKALADE